MAIHAHSTPMPAPQRGLLRAFAHPLAEPESTALVALLEPAEAAEARALHKRRRLGEALEYGFALLDALDLPPSALDVIDDAIAALDALEAAGNDMEDDDPADETSLETAGRGFVRCGADDAEEDDTPEMDDEPEGDGGEPYLSVCEFDGRGDNWLRSGNPTTGWGTDIEDANEDGSDDGREEPGWFAGEFDVPQVMRGMVEDAWRQSAVLLG